MIETICVTDHGVELEIGFDAAVLYHGKDSIGGLAAGFRLLAFALKKLCPDSVPAREDIVFKTAFPGPGVRDAVEMVTRAVSRGAWHVIDNPPVDTPEGVYGRLYFEVSVGARTIALQIADGAVSEEFIKTGRAVKAGAKDTETLAQWTALKVGLSQAVLSADPEKLYVVRSISS